MSEAVLSRIFGFNAGMATDLPVQARELNYFLTAENVLYEVSGGVRKVGGASKINATAMATGPDVVGMYDFWRGGGAASFTQKFVAVTADGKVYKDDMDGTFDDITGAATITASIIPQFSVARDLLIIMTSGNNAPLKWNMTGNVASLAGTPPVGRGMVYHVNRGWIWGVNANASRLYYSSSTDVEDWSGADSGSIDIDPEDGDRIVACYIHKKTLFVFKGPNRGSIHAISGTSPTGAGAFTREPLTRGIPLQTYNSIVPVADDLLFMSDRGIHSLAATQVYGNFIEADLTHHLKKFFRERINRTYMDKVWAVDYGDKSCILWTMAAAGSSENNMTFGLSYARHAEVGWLPFTWARGGISAAMRTDPTTRLRQVVFGGTDGFVRLQDIAARSIDGTTAYNFRLRTPSIIIATGDSSGNPRGDLPVAIENMWVRSESVGDYNIMITTRLDLNQEVVSVINQGAFGFLLSTTVLGTQVIGGRRMRLAYSELKLRGVGRAISFDISQAGMNNDAHLFEFGIEYVPASHTEVAV